MITWLSQTPIPSGWIPPPIAPPQIQQCAFNCNQNYGILSRSPNPISLGSCILQCWKTPPTVPTISTPANQSTEKTSLLPVFIGLSIVAIGLGVWLSR